MQSNYISNRSRAWALAPIACIAFALTACSTPAGAGNLTSPEDVALKRAMANAGEASHADDRTALLAVANQDWRWGSVSGPYTTSSIGGAKRCHPTADSSVTSYLKEGAPDAYARVLAYLLSETPNPRHAEEARAHVLALANTTGFHGLYGADFSAGNQCILELAISVPVWIETALLLEATPVWGEPDTAVFASWLANEAYPKVAWASRVRRNNWGAAGSTAASLIARYVEGRVPELVEQSPSKRTLRASEAKAEHDAMQLSRIGTEWQGDTQCDRVGIQGHGGIPDELRRGETGCDGTSIVSAGDSALSYQTMHVELLVIHAEALRRQGDTSLFDVRTPNGVPALLQAILFVIDNPSPGGHSWPWGDRTGALLVANRYYDDPRIAAEIGQAKSFRGGRTLPYATLLPPKPEPPMLLAP